MMTVTVNIPDEYTGVVLGDLNKRNGMISELSDRNNGRYIRAHIPVSNMFGYMTDLRTITSGRGNFNMVFSHYEAIT